MFCTLYFETRTIIIRTCLYIDFDWYPKIGHFTNTLMISKKETIVVDPMCMDERILCCTHSVTGIFMGSNNTVWQHVSSICSFIPCSRKIETKYLLTFLPWF